MIKCDYCGGKDNSFVPMNQTKEYSGIEMALNRQGMLRVRAGRAPNGDFETQDIVNIRYCPMCGRNFGWRE